MSLNQVPFGQSAIRASRRDPTRAAPRRDVAGCNHKCGEWEGLYAPISGGDAAFGPLISRDNHPSLSLRGAMEVKNPLPRFFGMSPHFRLHPMWPNLVEFGAPGPFAFPSMRKPFLRLLPLLGLLCGCEPRPSVVEPAAPSGGAGRLLSPVELTGGSLRAVWIREVGDGEDWRGEGDDLVLMGYDSRDGEGVRVLHEGAPNYNKPLLSPDGRTVVYTDLSDGVGRLKRIPWRGGDPEDLGEGLALDVWKDPEGTVWVYAGEGPMDYRGNVLRVFRFPLDDPSAREPVWEHKVARDNFQLGRSGRYAGGLFPAPGAGGVVDLDVPAFNVYAAGCWASLSPGLRGLLWVFDGRHRNLLFFASDESWLPEGAEDRWIVDITRVEGIDGRRVYYPRWSNHSRFFAVSGPMSHGAYERAEIYVGRFARDYRSVEAWAVLTDDDRPDLYPDVRVVPGTDGPPAGKASNQSAEP